MTALQALLGFTAWTVLLITVVFLYRGVRFLGGTAINHWPRRNKPSDDASLVTRIEDSHANCLENLPVFAAIVLGAAAMNKLDVIAPVAVWVLYARIGQSLVHMVGVDPLHVLVRATLWSVQLALFIWMLVKLLG